MKKIFAILTLLVTIDVNAAISKFPMGPNPELTPGSLCDHADSHRYPEQIAYCQRDVDREAKAQVIRDYDRKLGYRVQTMNRGDFKIDHFIPLCAGGSNNTDNLWPQHKSVYEITDPLEPIICEKMAKGALSQKEAIELIREAKTDLQKTPEIIAIVEGM